MNNYINNSDLVTPPNTISFWLENKEIFAVGVKQGKAFITINPETEPDIAGTEAAKVFWKNFEATLKDIIRFEQEKKYGDDLR